MANKSFSIVFDASMNVSQMASAIDKVQSKLNGLKLGGNFQKNFTGLLIELDEAIQNFEQKSSKEITSKKDLNELESATRKIVNLYDRLVVESKKLSNINEKELHKLLPDDLSKGLKEIQGYLNDYKDAVEKNNKEIKGLEGKRRKEQEKIEKKQNKDAAEGKKVVAAAELDRLKTERTKIKRESEQKDKERQQLEQQKRGLLDSGAMRIKKDGTADKRYGDFEGNQALLDKIKAAEEAIARLHSVYGQLDAQIEGSISETKYAKNLNDINSSIDEARKTISKLDADIDGLQVKPELIESFENIRKKVEQITGLDLSEITADAQGIERLEEVFNNFKLEKLARVREGVSDLERTIYGVKEAANQTGEAVGNIRTELDDLTRTQQDIDRLQDQVLDFFSLTNTIQIFKDAVRDAFETVKELDAVMTETAVVTDFSIGDMWDKLPQYTEQANRLGTSIKGLYEATTLYYQQGLNSAQAMDVGIETMKMARIANMDAAAATEAMTAALRGFNMEIDEINATRINDVYSELAAITASDTEQIATAMSKTASIASSANMEFETTAALLAQIIETTQEAPETAGTAMKTIIARFTEVKQLFSEGMLTGEDSEGEVIDINKIDTALKTVGISLKDFLTGTKGIDDIFLELASKWNKLDLATQRYIATTAAGSRQQSRFIAMMSNYDRTMELVTAANNSAGASQEQFDKTLESLEAKLQKLNNAWQEFTMGLANNEAIKFGVDLLTLLLETVNKITGVTGNEGLGGIITMLARLATVITALKGGEAIIKGVLKSLVTKGVINNGNSLLNWGKEDVAEGGLKNLWKSIQNGVGLFGKLGGIIKNTTIGAKIFGSTALSAGKLAALGFGSAVVAVGVLIGVVWVLVAAFKAIHAVSPEGRLEAAAEASNSAAEAANAATKAYDNLNNSLDSIAQKRKDLDSLIRGTSEWKNAVMELNTEVLDMVENYPELAEAVSNQGGILQVNGTRAQKELAKYDRRKIDTQNAKAAADIERERASQNNDFAQLAESAKVVYKNASEVSDNFATIYSRAETDELAKKIASGDINIRDFEEGGKYSYLGGRDSDSYKALEEYGQKLLASEAAIEVFANSLLSNAAMVSDVSEKSRDNIMNFMSSKQVEEIFQTQKKDIKKGKITEEEKQDYAYAVGYDYINGKFYTGTGAGQKEVIVSDEAIASQLAGIKTQKKLTVKMNALDAALTKIEDDGEGLASIFERMTERGEGAALTLQDVSQAKDALSDARDENFEDSELYKLYSDETLNLSNIYDSFEEFLDYYGSSTELAVAQIEKAQTKMSTAGLRDFFDENQGLKVGQISNIADLLYESVLKSGRNAGGELASTLSEGLGGKDGEKLAEALGLIDLERIDSIEQLSEILANLNYAGEINIADLEKQIIEVTKASKDFSLENLKEQIKSAQDLINDIEGREDTDRTYSQEQYNVLTKNGVDAKNFVMTGIDEFVYVGGTNEQLIVALQQNTAALLGKTGQQLKEAAEKSDIWSGLMSGDDAQKTQFDLLSGVATGETGIDTTNIGYVKEAMAAAGLIVDDLVNSATGRFVEGAERLMLDRIKAGYEQYGSVQAQNTNQSAYDSYIQSMPQAYYSSMTGQDILTSEIIYKDQEGQVLSQDQDQAARSAALDAKLVQQEGGMAEYETLRKENEQWAEHENLVKAAIVDAANYEKKVGKLADTIEDNAEALIDSKKGTREYEKALDKVTVAAQDAFGDNITKEFVEENLDLFKEFAKGTKGSADNIREAIVESLEGAKDITAKQFAGIQKAATDLDGLNFDIYGHADGSQIFSELANVTNDAKAAAELIRSLGYSVDWVETGVNELGLPSYKAIITNTAGNIETARRGKGGGGGGGKDWENPYDKLYNITENINRTLRKREKLERRYQILLDKRLTTAEALRENSLAELASLKEQADYQNQMIKGRQEKLREHLEENKELSKYGTYDFENQMVVIDWEKIDAVKDSKEGEKIEAYISKLEELRDSLQDAEDGLDDIEDQVQEINERGRDEYFELEERIKEAIIETRQKEIDTMEEINNSINETNSKLLDAIEQSIDKIRQDRENARTEEDIQEKQRQLAYLQQDTSGANDMAILALQEEIRQSQEDYTDTLIDQKISELQQQNDEAAEQREQQIAILQSQLDHYIESGEVWKEVYELMGSGLDEENGLIRGSKLEQILKDSESWSGMSTLGQMTWLEELEDMAAQAVNYLKLGRQLENLEMSGQTIEFTTADGKTLSGTVDEDGNVTVDGYTYEDIYQNWDGSYLTDENYQESKDRDSIAPETPEAPEEEEKVDKPYVPTWYFQGKGYTRRVDGSDAIQDWENSQIAKATENYNNGIFSKSKYEAFKKTILDWGRAYYADMTKILPYKTGGLADFTGPAWLDGTKSKPELVLNARDTQNFIQLKDILSSLMSRNFSNSHTSTENNGDITYDIDINVESIGNDYDIEQVANKIKSMIGEDARYRNNNAISLKR